MDESLNRLIENLSRQLRPGDVLVTMGAGDIGKACNGIVATGFEKIVRSAEPLASYTYFRIGGPAEYFAEPNNVDELAALVRRCRDEGVATHVLGGGSNILIRDEGVTGMVIQLTAAVFNEVAIRAKFSRAGGWR